jgi:hypothetical protein
MNARAVALVALLLGGCSNGCTNPFTPLPAPLPPSQIIEGGVQVRVTQNGLKTLTSAALDIINNLVGSGVCIPQASQDLGIATLYACYKNQCGGGATGCNVAVTINQLTSDTVGSSTVRVDVDLSGSTTVPLKIPTFLGDITCNLGVSISHGHIIADVAVGTSSTTGEITLNLGNIDQVDVSPQFNFCDLPSFLQDIIQGGIDFVFALVGTDFGTILINLFRDPLNNFIQGLLPSPLGLEGVLDVGSLLSNLVPGVEGKLEVKAVPGGYAQTPAKGVSVGIVAGINADSNPATRTGAAASEPVRCVPALPPPDLSGKLMRVPGRNTFSLKPAGAFLGVQDPASDVVFGVSETFLNLAGHHAVTSGVLCLGLGSAQIPQLNLGTLGLLIPSLSELGSGREPISLVLRPTTALVLTVGTGSDTSPFINAHIEGLEADLYALIYERYVRALTLSLTADVGLSLEFMLENGKPVLTPTLVGLTPDKITVKILDSEFLRESPAQLEAVFPTVVSLLLPLLSSALPSFPVPDIEGFTLGALDLGRVDTSEDHFLAVYASLAKATLGKPRGVLENLPPLARTAARVARVHAPSPEALRAGAIPEVELDLGGLGGRGMPLEWQWSLDRGMWRPFSADAHPILRDAAFGIQGRHTLRIRAREAGDWRTTDIEGVALPLVIDSAPPRLDVAHARVQGDELIVSATDLVTEARSLQWALGRADGDAPATAWAAVEGHLARADITGLLDGNGRVRVFVRDERGNATSAVLEARVFADAAPAASGGCSHGRGAPLAGALPLLGVLLWRARRRLLPFAFLAACSSAQVGPPPVVVTACTVDADCADKCPTGQVGACATAGPTPQCVCTNDIVVGPTGPWTSLAATSTGAAWVSAYNQLHGDLMVAKVDAAGRMAPTMWEFADGVPAGPVVLTNSHVRGGIVADGDDVGLYTSTAVTAAGDPMVAHYDRTNRGLRYAARVGGVWKSHAVDTGDLDSKDVGRHTSISVGADGKPGIAYLAVITEGRAVRSEVRYAQAKTTAPAGPSDWQVLVVEAATAPDLPPPDEQLDDVPNVVGAFVASARKSTGAPVVVYYDRPNGRLKLAELDGASGAFKTPVVAAAKAGADWGWYPSVAIGSDDSVHVAFVDVTKKSLLYTRVPGTPEVVDDGYREDGTVTSGLVRPVFHRVGDNATLLVRGTAVAAIVYADSTSHELLTATRGTDAWSHQSVAGKAQPFAGAYGFFVGGGLGGTMLVSASYVIDLPTSDTWVEVFRQAL